MTTVKAVYFAWVRETAGTGEETLKLPEGVKNGHQIIEFICNKYSGLEARSDTIQLAINQEHVARDTEFSDGDEVAFFPPVTGG